MKRLLIPLLLFSCGFGWAREGLVAFVSKVGERALDLVVVTPEGKEKARLNVWGENGDLRALTQWGYKIVLQPVLL